MSDIQRYYGTCEQDDHLAEIARLKAELEATGNQCQHWMDKYEKLRSCHMRTINAYKAEGIREAVEAIGGCEKDYLEYAEELEKGDD